MPVIGDHALLAALFVDPLTFRKIFLPFAKNNRLKVCE